MRIVSWNVNGVRAVLAKDFIKDMSLLDPDILCLQEIKAKPEQVNLDLPGYEAFWYSAQKPGYSGTMVVSKKKPKNVLKGMGKDEFDSEGRVLTLEFNEFFLVNTYIPNAQPELARLPYKQRWHAAFRDFVAGLPKPVILCGDLNVAHQERDLARPKDNRRNPGFTDEERSDMDALLGQGLVDIWRKQHPDQVKYSWWSYRFSARAKNIGWRIDYFLVSEALRSRVVSSEIHNEITGSDHCPVSIMLR